MRKLVSLLLVFCLLLSMTACHGNVERTEFSIPAEFDTSRTYEITFWAKNDTNNTQVQIYKNAIEEFEKCYPNIKVNLTLYTNYGDIYNDVITNMATDTTPNVCITYPDHIATYLEGNNTVVPLDGLLADPQYGLGGSALQYDGPTQIVDRFAQEGKINGTTYALPYMRSTEACYVNKTYVEKLGYELPEVLTWDFIWEVSNAATAKNPDGTYVVNGQDVMIPFIYKSTDNMMISYLAQMNAPYSKADGTVGLFNDTTTDFLYDIADATKAGAFSTFKISGYPANFLNAGQCIFAIDSTAGATWMGAEAPLIDIPEDKRVSFETEVMMIPQVDPENPKMISQGPSLCVFNKEDPQEVLASWLFAQFMLTDGVQIAYAQTEGYLPVTVDAQENPRYLDYLSRSGEDNDLYYRVKLDATFLMLENIPNTFVTPVFNGSASLRDAAGHLIEEVTKGTRRKKTIDDAFIETLYAETISLKRLDQMSVTGGAKAPLGPMPVGSKILLWGLVAIWLSLVSWFILDLWKRKRKKA